MSDETSNVVPIVSRASRLADALQRVRSREQTRDREIVSAREAARDERLKALAEDLRAMADEMPANERHRFALTMSQADERLIIDALSYVDLHPETADYRLVRQQLDGISVVAEHTDRELMAESVAEYVAEQIVEREGSAGATPAAAPASDETPASAPRADGSSPSRFWFGFWLFVLGGVCSATALFTYAWLQAGPPG